MRLFGRCKGGQRLSIGVTEVHWIPLLLLQGVPMEVAVTLRQNPNPAQATHDRPQPEQTVWARPCRDHGHTHLRPSHGYAAEACSS